MPLNPYGDAHRDNVYRSINIPSRSDNTSTLECRQILDPSLGALPCSMCSMLGSSRIALGDPLNLPLVCTCQITLMCLES